ncbi:MAG: ATP-binding protein [Anaerolineae bacterium]
MLLRASGLHRSNWSAVQYDMARGAAALFGLFAWVTWFQQLSSMAEDVYILVLVFTLSAICLWLAFRCRSSPVTIALLLTICAFVGASIPLLALGHPYAAPFLALPVVLSAFLLGPVATVPLSVVSAFLIHTCPTVPQEAVWPYSFLILSLGFLCLWLARCLRLPLWQAWQTAEDVAALTRELRLRQQEVNKLNKALTTANGLLKRSLHELSLAQKEALEARRLKEEFATTVSHELRTPLNTILGFLEMMQRYPEVYGEVTWTPELRRDIAEMQSSARYLSQLVDDILDLARIQALKMPIHREATDLLRLIREVADLAFRLLLEKTQVSLQLDLPSQLPPLYVDPTRIEQVLLNLVANACRFTDCGRITIGARREADEAVVYVSDTGPGIPEDELGRVFEAFIQSSSVQAERLLGAGKGLGLAIAKRFVSMHGGRIWAESRLGHGSTFYFALPIAAKQVVALPPPTLHEVEPADAPPRRLIVVDSGEEAGRFLSRHLEGLEVLSAASLSEAHELAYQWHPHALLVNVPPDSHEVTFPGSPRMFSVPVPVIYCSLPVGGRLPESELFDDWLVKPVTGDRLAAILEKLPSARRVLVVDDDVPFAHLIQRFLQAQGNRHEVLVAHDGESALRLAEQAMPELVFLDIALPDMDGRKVARMLRHAHGLAEIHLVAVTALQPGLEDTGDSPRSFAVESRSGFSEEETLLLIKSCLAHLKPVYLPEPPA